MTHLTLFTVNFVGVFCRSFQQLNVTKYKYKWIPPISYVMQVQLLFNVGYVARYYAGIEEMILFVLVSGTGAWMGSFCGMWLHRRLR